MQLRGDKMKNNITLIGMPGAGKSTVGVVLAKILGYKFIDSDLVMQEREGKLLHTIIEEKGREGFIRFEEEINSSIELDRCVYATGGSAVYGEKAMNYLRENSNVIYLKLSYKAIAERLGDLRERGVVLKKGETLRDLFDSRCVLYEKYAHYVIDAQNMNIKAVALEIKKLHLGTTD